MTTEQDNAAVVRRFSPKAGPVPGHLLVGLSRRVVALAWRCWTVDVSRRF